MKHKLTAQSLATYLIILGSFTGGADAAVSFSQSDSNITMTVTNETYLLSANQTDDILFVAFLDVFTVGGNDVLDSSRVSGSASASINGGPTISLSWWGGWQFRPGFQSPWTPEDAAFLFQMLPNTLSAGDQITINGTLTMNSLLDSDIQMPTLLSPTTKTVIGGHFSLNSAPRDISAIPEPSALSLIGFTLASVLMRRRRIK